MWIKNIRQRKLQIVMIFLIIAICTTLLAGAMSILTSLDKPCRDFAKTCNAVTAKFYPYSKDLGVINSYISQFVELSNVKEVEYVKRHYLDENIIINQKRVELFANLIEYNDKVFGQDVYLEGDHSASSKLAKDECILPACISNEYDIHTGDTVTIEFEKGEFNYKVAAVYTDPYQTSTAFDCDLLVSELPVEKGNDYILYLYGKDGVSGKEIETSYREKYDGVMNGVMSTLEERTDHSLVVGRIIGAIFLALGVIMLSVSGLMIHYMVKNAMISDAKSIAVFKTIGYTSNDILFMYLKMYTVIVSLGCAAGIGCSVIVSNTILTSIFRNMGQLQASNSFVSGVLCYLVIVSFVILVIIVNIAGSKRIKPVYSLNGIDYGGVKKKKRYKGNSSMQFSAFGIAYRTFSREKRSAAGTLITCIVTVFCVNFIVISLDIANTMKENNDFWIGIDRSDVMISVSDPSVYEKVKSIAEKDNRTDYCLDSIQNVPVSLKWRKGMDITRIYAFVYADFKAAKLPVTQGRNPESGNEIALSTTMAEKLHKSIGDYLEVYLDDNTEANFLITGFFQSYMQFGELCRLTASAYSENDIDVNYNNISVYLKDSKDTESFMNDMKEQIGGSGNVQKRTEQYGSIMDMITKPQQKAIPPVAVLIMVMAGLNIFSIVYLRNLKSQTINGIYKSIGYTTGHLIGANLCYVTATALVCVVITFPISLFSYTPIMQLSLSMFHFQDYPMQVNLFHLVIANTAVMLVFVLSTLASSKALFKVSARDLIQE